MSFKRDGDDLSQLNILKKRRVAELFAHHIPDDEALLMSNGRYACTVCHYKPVFDTLQMLTIHRQGKKHQHCLDEHYRKKREYMQLVAKRRHENYIKNEYNEEQEDPLPLLTKTSEKTKNVLLKATPYNSCVKWGRPKVNSNDRQQASTTGLFFTSDQYKPLKHVTEVKQHDIQTPRSSEVQQSQPLKHHMVSKVEGYTESSTPIMPYIPKSKRKQSHSDNRSATEKHLNGPAKEIKKQCSKVADVKSLLDSSELKDNSKLETSDLAPKQKLNSGLVQNASKSLKKQLTVPDTKIKRKNHLTNKEEEIKRILHLTSSGWKRDRSGKWVKDENVEFDSDEETPT